MKNRTTAVGREPSILDQMGAPIGPAGDPSPCRLGPISKALFLAEKETQRIVKTKIKVLISICVARFEDSLAESFTSGFGSLSSHSFTHGFLFLFTIYLLIQKTAESDYCMH